MKTLSLVIALLLPNLALATDSPETISAKCPSTWQIERVQGKRSGWSYLCRETGTLIVISDGNGRDSAGLKGSTKGDKHAAWKR